MNLRAERLRMLDEARAINPFAADVVDLGNGPYVIYATSGGDRMDALSRFTQDECWQALQLPDLQTTVITALQRRMRRLAKEAVT